MKPSYPYYFFKFNLLESVLEHPHDAGEYTEYSVKAGGKTANNAARRYARTGLSDLVYLEFGAMDAWFEENEEIYVHPKDPYKVCMTMWFAEHLLSILMDLLPHDDHGPCSGWTSFIHHVTFKSKWMALK